MTPKQTRKLVADFKRKGFDTVVVLGSDIDIYDIVPFSRRPCGLLYAGTFDSWERFKEYRFVSSSYRKMCYVSPSQLF